MPRPSQTQGCTTGGVQTMTWTVLHIAHASLQPSCAVHRSPCSLSRVIPFTQPKPQNNPSFSYNFICHSSFPDTVKDTFTDPCSSVLFTVVPMIPCVPMLKINELQHFRINAGLSSAFNFSRLSRPIDSTSHACCLPFLHSPRPEDNRRGLASFF